MSSLPPRSSRSTHVKRRTMSPRQRDVDGLTSKLHGFWMRRHLKHGQKASPSDLAFWVWTAMASGIVGNVAYDVLKALVKKLRPNEVKDENVHRLVAPEDYEALRLARGQDPAVPELQPAVARQVKALPPGGARDWRYASWGIVLDRESPSKPKPKRRRKPKKVAARRGGKK